MAHEVALDETLQVEGPELVEGALLQRLEEHQADLEAFLQELAPLRGGTSVSQLQQLLLTASQLQAKLGLATDMSKTVAGALEKAGIPVEPLQEAKALMLARSRFESEVAETGSVGPAEKLGKLMESWEQLRRAEAACGSSEFFAVFGRLDLGDQGSQREQLQSLCETLLLQVDNEEAGHLEEALQKMGIEVKPRALGVAAPSNGEAETFSSPSKRTDARSPKRSLEAEAAVARSRSPTPPPGMRTVTTAGSPSAAQDRRGATGASVIPEVTFSGGGLNSFIESQKQALLKEREAEKASGKQVVEDEPRSLVTFGVKGEALPVAPARALKAPSAPPSGTAELWRAVHVGDQVSIARLIHQGLCNGLQRDASGHSVLWHAIAFGHLGLARMMLERFPPGTQEGVDLTEVHHRKGDSFLHLLCQCRPFSAETAQIFKELAEGMPKTLFHKVNAAGQSFLAFACATQNFWVLRHISLRYPEQMKVLICSTEVPLRFLVQQLPAPSPPSFSTAEYRIPEHVAVSALLSPDASGRVPFADVAFDVCTAEDSFSRFLAHRVLVASQSPVLLKELSEAPLQDLPQEGIRACVFQVDRRISKEVWRSILQFLYTGAVHCPFAQDPVKMVELLRACVLYQLPKALLDLAQTALFKHLPAAPSVALEIFSISGEGPELKCLRDASMRILLRSAPEIFLEMAPEKLSTIMDKLIVLAEQSIFQHTQVT